MSFDRVDEIIKNIPMGIAISDNKGRVKNVNKKFLDMFGYKWSKLDNLSMDRILEDFKSLKNILEDENEFEDREVYVRSKTNKLRFTLSMDYIERANKEPDILYLFSDQKKERKQAARIQTNLAIYSFDKIIYRSEIFQRTIEFAKKISDSKSTVLITGETGTGKEIFAQSIHNYSSRGEMPFIAINAAAIPASLIESELFGYEGGAFTGARKQGQAGKFEIADKGTIFLDEIGEMPLDLQTRLLRVLEEGIVSRVGSVEQNYVDVRIIAASNKDLMKEVRDGNFRDDLFYRLNVLPLKLPALVEFFMEKLSKSLNKRKVEISNDEMEILLAYDWPGNVRELENLVELLINLEYIPEEIIDSYREERDLENALALEDRKISQNFQQGNEKQEDFKSFQEDNDISAEKRARVYALEEIEKNHISYMLEKNDYNITLTASELEIARNTLYRKMDKFDLG